MYFHANYNFQAMTTENDVRIKIPSTFIANRLRQMSSAAASAYKERNSSGAGVELKRHPVVNV